MSFQVKPGSTLGRLGEGIGKGLSEQVPKEIERFRLSSGLKKLQENPNSSPLDRLVQLFTTPGITPEIAGKIEPFLRNAAILNQRSQNENISRGNNGNEINQINNLQKSNIPTDLSTQQNTPLNLQPEPEKTQLDTSKLISGTTEGLRDLGFKLTEENPNLFPTFESGLEEANRRFTNQQNNINQAVNAFDRVLENKIQKSGSDTFGDVLGDLQNDFRNKAINSVLNGESPLVAANRFAEQARRLAFANQNLKTLASQSIIQDKPSKNLEKLDSIRNKFKELGQLEAFKDELVGNNILSEPYANLIAFPIETNKEIGRDFNELPNAFKANRGKTPSIEDFRKNSFKHEKDFANKIAPKLKGSDSLLSIATGLKEKNFDPAAFLTEIQKLQNEGKIELTERQQTELQKNRNFRKQLKDIYLFTLSGLSRRIGK